MTTMFADTERVLGRKPTLKSRNLNKERPRIFLAGAFDYITEPSCRDYWALYETIGSRVQGATKKKFYCLIELMTFK